MHPDIGLCQLEIKDSSRICEHFCSCITGRFLNYAINGANLQCARFVNINATHNLSYVSRISSGSIMTLITYWTFGIYVLSYMPILFSCPNTCLIPNTYVSIEQKTIRLLTILISFKKKLWIIVGNVLYLRFFFNEKLFIVVLTKIIVRILWQIF